MLLGSVVMPGRRGGGRRSARKGRDQPYTAPGSEHPDTWPPTQEPGPSVQTSTLPEPEPELYTGPDPASRGTDDRRRPAPDDGDVAPDQHDTAPHPVAPDEGPDADGRPHG